ncbi:MAG: hypothetical protein K2Y27_04230, partial [Xanthobacteraceae bacterium]|nr:hypothetical protein [Xanthobacteraceae bacterium]
STPDDSRLITSETTPPSFPTNPATAPAVAVEQFYGTIYRLTPAHTDEIHAAIIENPDLEVTTEGGGERRKPNTIRAGDTLRMKQQRTFFPIFFGANKKT